MSQNAIFCPQNTKWRIKKNQQNWNKNKWGGFLALKWWNYWEEDTKCVKTEKKLKEYNPSHASLQKYDEATCKVFGAFLDEKAKWATMTHRVSLYCNLPAFLNTFLHNLVFCVLLTDRKDSFSSSKLSPVLTLFLMYRHHTCTQVCLLRLNVELFGKDLHL